MSIKNEFSFVSRDGITQIKSFSWSPDDGNIRGILQIVHGMIEYVKRYDEFAEFMTTQGFLVVGEDHIGHGYSAPTEKDLGYFIPKDASTILVRDVHRLKKIIQEQHPGIPYFILGHSMGSFILRNYLFSYGSGIDGALISGTAIAPKAITNIGITLTNLIGCFHNDRYKSKLLTKMTFNGYTSKIENASSPNDWLSTDTNVVHQYDSDVFCTYVFSLNAYRTLLKLIKSCCNFKYLESIPTDLPVYIYSGLEDPVGHYGKDPSELYNQFKLAGIQDISLKLYPGFRHEPHNEIDKQKCYDDVLQWLNSHIINKSKP